MDPMAEKLVQSTTLFYLVAIELAQKENLQSLLKKHL